METEHIDKLFLELSQFTKATTKREADLTARLAEAEVAARWCYSHLNNYRQFDAEDNWPWLKEVRDERSGT